MSREWKPGDVALIRSSIGHEVIGLRSGVPSNMGWAYTGGGPTTRQYGNCWMSDREATAVVRPLAVIDPECEADVEWLMALSYKHAGPDYHAVVQAAFREFANPTPPKPDEPQGLGAVVEDANYTRWTRVESGEAETRNPWYPAHDPALQPAEWDDIAAVRVLSEGVVQP